MLWQLVATVAVWWGANAVTSIASKSVMTGEDANAGWLPALKDFRWLELTALQHLVGAVGAAVCLKAVLRTSLHPPEASKRAVLLATLGNVAGNLATNVAYVMISSSSTQVIKAFEPLFTLLFSLVLYRKPSSFDGYSYFISIPIMIAGASAFVLRDSSFNIWGVTAAVASNIAFPIRNIFFKKLLTNNSWQNSLQNYAVISVYSSLVLAPVLVVKLVVTKVPLVIRLDGGMVSAVLHSTYNIASVAVLQNVSPLTHAILNLSKRIAVILANIAYFHTPLSFSMAVGLVVFCIGLALYQTSSSVYRKLCSSKIKLLVISVATVACTFMAVEPYLAHSPVALKSLKCNIITPQQNVSTAWVFDRAMPTEVLTSIQNVSAQNPCMRVHVYCGTIHCMNAVSALNIADITAEFLVLTNIVRDTPLELWLARHPINKVLAGVQFEEHLNDAVRLGILWSHGGIYFDATVIVAGGLTFPSSHDAWTSIEQGKGTSRLLDVAYFPRHHPFIGKLAERFFSDYSRIEKTDVKFKFDFQDIAWNTYTNPSTNSPTSWPLEILSRTHSTSKKHYGTLSYNIRFGAKYVNLGDEIQGFPGVQFLPFVDSFVERDKLSLSAGNETITTFFNAWWGTHRFDWPPPSNVDPIMLSVHINHVIQDIWALDKEYLKTKAPIGCRDYSSLAFLRSLDIDAYFSGCLTLMLRNPNIHNKRTDDIFLVDVKTQFVDLLPLEVQQKVIAITHNVTFDNNGNLARFTAAYKLMEKYASAKLVITQRIHCALPCVAMGIPVIFINSDAMPGGGGTITARSSRTAGLTPMFHTLDLYSKSMEDARQWLHNFTWHNPPPNPDVGMAMRLKATAWNVIRRNQAFYDAARKFGLLPLSLPAPATNDQLLFHLIFTTSNNFNWRHWRTVESIFFHHPLAKVIVHSNTLSQSEFAVLTEAGYTIEVQQYTLEELLENSPAQTFTRNFRNFEQGKHWFSHQTDLLRYLILYKWGGVYVDTDVIIVRPVVSLPMNVMGWQDPHNATATGAFMMFEKGNPFLSACLKEFAEHYNSTLWGYNGPGLLTRVWSHSFRNSSDIHVLHSHAFYMFHYKEVKERCFNDVSELTRSLYMKILKEEAYAVHLNSKITAPMGLYGKLRVGTMCKYLLNSFCILCDKQY